VDSKKRQCHTQRKQSHAQRCESRKTKRDYRLFTPEITTAQARYMCKTASSSIVPRENNSMKKFADRRAGSEITCKQTTKVYEIDERILSNCFHVLGNQADAKHCLLQRVERDSMRPRMPSQGLSHPGRSP
jgi:hypothetical protein